MEQNIQMVDLKTQYHHIKDQIDHAVIVSVSLVHHLLMDLQLKSFKLIWKII